MATTGTSTERVPVPGTATTTTRARRRPAAGQRRARAGRLYVPMATAEGTLVASYNRGMRLLHEAGGVTTTIMDDRMQPAPAFLFASARQARTFGEWLEEHFEIKQAAESTTRSGKLQNIKQYSASRILYTRFNYTTGDAAGQNLTGKATQAACKWIASQYTDIEHYFLESNFATDKRARRSTC
jgi:hydroxymethylglutaryl-CoA reductase (NADPH)